MVKLNGKFVSESVEEKVFLFLNVKYRRLDCVIGSIIPKQIEKIHFIRDDDDVCEIVFSEQINLTDCVVNLT